MKFTVIFATVLSISWATKVNPEDPKGKREASIGYHSAAQSLGGHYSPQAFSSHGDGNAVSIGAGYSIGGAKPSYGFMSGEEGQTYQLSSGEAPSGHAAIQLPPITLQPGHGSGLVSNDLQQLMSQLSHGLNSGQLQLSSFQDDGQSAHGSQEIAAAPQYSVEEPKLQQYALAYQSGLQSVPSYAAGTKGLGSYSSTGPVLFNPELNSNQYGLKYAAPSGGHSFEAGALSGGLSLEDFGKAYGSGAQGLGGRYVSAGGNTHSFGGSKVISLPGKASFKPSLAFSAGLGGSVHGGAPSFGSYSLSGGHGLSLGASSHGHGFGSSQGSLGGISKYYLPSKKGYSSLDAFSAASHSPPRTTYGVPTASYSSGSSASLSSHSPRYPSFGEGTSSFKGVSPFRGSLSSYSSSSGAPKYTFGSHSSSSSHFIPPKDIEGSYSENTYNTIKYSEEMRPHM